MNEAIFGFIGVIVGAFIPLIKEIVNEYFQRTRHAKYVAIQVICVLDEFINKCADVVRDDGTDQGQPAGGERGEERFNEPQVSPPDAPNYPSGLDWKSIDVNLLSRIAMLPNKIRSANIGISHTLEYDGAPEYSAFFEARWESYSDLGLEALDICDKLQKAYKLPKFNFRYYNPHDIFNEKKAEIEKKRKRADKLESDEIENASVQLQTTLTAPTK
jgi:hypothetical protein